jgi:hypothetical protein
VAKENEDDTPKGLGQISQSAEKEKPGFSEKPGF